MPISTATKKSKLCAATLKGKIREDKRTLWKAAPFSFREKGKFLQKERLIPRCTAPRRANLGRLILRYADAGGRPMNNSEFWHGHGRMRVARDPAVEVKVYDDRGLRRSRFNRRLFATVEGRRLRWSATRPYGSARSKIARQSEHRSLRLSPNLCVQIHFA